MKGPDIINENVRSERVFSVAKAQSPSFVLSLGLAHHPRIFAVISDELEICRVIYNTILGQYLKLEEQMKREKQYKKLIRQYKGVSKKLQTDKDNPFLMNELKLIRQKLKALREKYQLTEYASHHWVKPVRKHFQNRVNAMVAQKIASREKMFGQAQNVQFIRKGDMISFEGKTNKTGWRYVDHFIVYKDLSTPLIINHNDTYTAEVIQHLDQKTPFSYTVISNGIQRRCILKSFKSGKRKRKYRKRRENIAERNVSERHWVIERQPCL